jgi:hypothetical protein
VKNECSFYVYNLYIALLCFKTISHHIYVTRNYIHTTVRTLSFRMIAQGKLQVNYLNTLHAVSSRLRRSMFSFLIYFSNTLYILWLYTFKWNIERYKLNKMRIFISLCSLYFHCIFLFHCSETFFRFFFTDILPDYVLLHIQNLSENLSNCMSKRRNLNFYTKKMMLHVV